MRDWQGRAAIVTGASSGIGVHVARALVERGANVVLAARSADKLATVATELSKLTDSKSRVLAVPTDVTSLTDLERLVARTHAEFGQIDVLVNNAGIDGYCPFEKITHERISKIVDVNLTSAMHLTRLVIPHMLKQGGGHVVSMSSTAGQVGPAFGAAYGVTKAGLIAFTESLRAEYADRWVSASVICPGFTNDGGIYEEMKRRTGRGTPATIGYTTASAVAKAVIKAIEHDKPELIVNTPPMRPVFVLKAMWPTLGNWIVRKASRRFLKKIATQPEPSDSSVKAA